MKKMLAIMGLMAMMSAAFAAYPYESSALKIRVEERGNYSVEVNGRSYPARTGSVQLHDLQPGHYDVRVIQHDVRSGRFAPSRARRVIYAGQVFVPRNTLVRGRLDRRGMRFRRAAMVQQQPARTGYVVSHANYGAVYAMHPANFNGLMDALRRTPFDRTRSEIARAALASNMVSTQQVAVMMREFSFDRYKLDVAKVAYERCVDPENYFLLVDEFTFDSSARELMRYIR